MPITTTRRTAIGWSVLEPKDVPAYVIPVAGGTVTMRLRPGDTADILVDLVKRYDATVERVRQGEVDDWSYARRPVRGGSTIWSEHAAGTAIDLNATKHFRGSKGTFTHEQLVEIDDLLDLYEGVVAWGGNFKTTVDEMHFEITVPPGDPKIARVAAKIRALEDELSAKDVAEIKAAIAAQTDAVADAVIYKLIHKQYTGDEGGVQLDKRSIAGVGLVGARASMTLVAAVAELSKQVTAVAVAVADDATKAQVQEIGDKVDQLLAEVAPADQPPATT